MAKVTYSYKTIVSAPLHDVWAFFSVPTNITKLSSFPKASLHRPSEMKAGNKLRMTLSFFVFRVKWVVLFEEVDPPNRFVDSGMRLPFPFQSWRHEHSFMLDEDKTIMTDTVVCQSILPAFIMNVMLRVMFRDRERHLHTLVQNNELKT